MEQSILEFIKNQTFTISDQSYVILKTSKLTNNAFAQIQTPEETTVIMDQHEATHEFFTKDIISMDRNWKKITFNVELPFDMIGFLATISKALAERKIPIFVISAYSTDHLLIKDKYMDEAIDCLEKMGFKQ